MPSRVSRVTADLTGYPDLVVIYLGMRVNSLRGLRTLVAFGPRISKAVEEKPDGLLLHENLFFGFFPPHFAMRQYWRDFDSLERWARAMPHQKWWQDFVGDSGGTGFWHETYFIRGGMESIFDDMRVPVGFTKFAPSVAARGAMFSARKRLGLAGESPAGPVAEEWAWLRLARDQARPPKLNLSCP